MENHYIKNINETDWFRSMVHYPKTIDEFKLLVSIVDKMNIFSKYDLHQIIDMHYHKLDILYAILLIMNKVFNGYLDYSVKKIFRDGLKELFACTDLQYYDIFFDQVTQDMDHFICIVVKKYYSKMDIFIIKNKFVEYLDSTFKKKFYVKILKKLSYDVNQQFYKQNDKYFTVIIEEFISHTNDILNDTYKTMSIFLDKIFNPKCSSETVDEIIYSLKKHINLKNIFEENYMEIDIYIEQKLNNICEPAETVYDSNDEINKKVFKSLKSNQKQELNYIG